MTKKLLAKIRKTEQEAESYEINYDYDPDNNAVLELAHEICDQVAQDKTLSLDDAVELSLDSCMNTINETYLNAKDKIEAL